MKKKIDPELKRLKDRLESTKSELQECRDTLLAIQSGEVDALVVNDGEADRIFTLKNADQPYRIFVETMNEGAVTLSQEGLIYFCNQRFADIVGRKLENVIGSSIYDIFPNSDLPDFKQFVVGKNTKGKRAFIVHTLGKLHIHLQLSMSVVQLEESKGICVVATDLSEQRRLEESKADVERLKIEKEIRERFVSTLTHDLRTPLTAGLLAGQLLIRKDFHPDDVKKIGKRIAGNMERADGMIRDLLDSNRIKAGEGLPVSIQECTIDQVVESAVSTLSQIYGPRFKVQMPTKSVKGYWDPLAIQRCIENLASNAIKYGKPKSHVTISVKAVDKKVVVSVHNEGDPISVNDQESLFNPYRRTDSALRSGQKGWGIGLTLVKGLTESHGGEARVKSDAKSGTTFFIELPIDSRKYA